MRKQLLSAVAGLFFVSAIAAVIPQLDKAPVEKAMLQKEVKMTPAEKMAQTEVVAVSSALENPFMNEKASKLIGNQSESFEFVESSKLGEDQPILGVAKQSDKPAIARAPQTRAGEAPALEEGTFITKELSYRGTKASFRLELEKGKNANEWLAINVLGRGDTVVMNVNNGVVTIEPQVVEVNSTYGDISILPMVYENSQLFMAKGNITGTINDKGDIVLSPYGLVVTQMDDATTPGKYYGAVFNMFTQASWCVPNVVVSATSISGTESKIVMYESLFDQDSENELTLYGLGNFGAASDVLSARLTADKRIVVPSQLMYSNLFYGPFQNYPALFEYDSTQGKWKVTCDRKNPMEIVSDGKGSYKLAGWLIGAKSAPTMYTGYAYHDVSIETDYVINYPAPKPMNMTGSGTAADPYMVKSYADLQAIADATESGNDLAGVNFKLANNLSLGSVAPASYVAIGNATTPFAGVFDGDGKTISDLYINGTGFLNTGMFGVIGAKGVVKNINFSKCIAVTAGENVGIVAGESAGTISNVNVTQSVVDCNGELGGGIVGNLTTGSLVENCSFSGSAMTEGSVGGIAGEGLGATIIGCSVRANLTVDAFSSVNYNKQCGGIIGTAMNQCVISNCYVSGTITDKAGYAYTAGICAYLVRSEVNTCFNTAPIQAKRTNMGSSQYPDDGETHTGGIVGYITESKLYNSYNSGTIIKNDKSKYVGGVVSYLGVGYSTTGTEPTKMIYASDIQNCYNTGQIISYYDWTNKGVFGDQFVSSSYKGPSPEEVCIKNCYFDAQIQGQKHPVYGKTTRELTSALPEGFDSSVWTMQAGSYPMLKVGTGTATQALSVAPLTLRPNDNSNKVKVEFDIAASQQVGWTLSYDAEAGETATETGALKINGNKVVVKDKYDVSVVQALSSDNWGLKLYRLSVVPKLFDGEGIAEDPYLIKTVADFKNLAEAVSTYGQTHEDDHFAMANDIDFSANPEFVGVGTYTANEFHGTFDGKNHTVKGLKIDAGTYDADGKAIANNTRPPYTGLFGIIGSNGTVKNVNMSADNDFTFYQYGGPIVGLNCGVVENCRNYADVKSISSYTGGIAGVNYNGGKISKCYNAGKVYYGVTNAGGITGYNQPNAVIEYCQNDGDVLNTVVNIAQAKTKQNTAGGIVAYNYGSVDNCVNNGTVRAFNTVGGIAGTSSAYNGEGTISNCVNNAMVTCLDNDLKRGGIIGYRQYECKTTNNYFDASLNINGAAYNSGLEGCTGLSSSELVSGQALAGLDAQVYDFKENAYPVLKMYADEDAAKAMRSIYVGFAQNTKRTNVLKDTPLANVAGLSFKLLSSEGEPQEGVINTFNVKDNVLTVGALQGHSVSTDSLTATLGERYIKTYNIGAVPVILDGEGTAEKPYLIKSPEDWNLLANFMEESKWEYEGDVFSITNDIDFKNDSIRLLGVNGVNFQGILEGNNHTIKNYVYRNNNTVTTASKLTGPNFYVAKYLGLIGTLGIFGEMKNLTLDGELIFHSYGGMAVGENYGKIINVTNKGKVETYNSGYIGGIAGRTYGGSVIDNCVNEGTVISKTTYPAGIVYETKADSKLTNCVNKGTVQATTTYACGIAYKVAGEMTNCVNEGKVLANSSVYGIANTLDKTAYVANCVNKSDLDLRKYCADKGLALASNGANIHGMFGTLTALTVAREEGSKAGIVENCHNEGKLDGKSGVYGCFNTINKGWIVRDCYNTGDVLSYLNDDVTPVNTNYYAAGFAYSITGATADLKITLERCYNTGRVVGSGGGVAGLLKTTPNFCDVIDCYNTGDVVNLSTGALCTGGIVGTHNGVLVRCYNTGKIFSYGNAVGGLVGYISSGHADYPAKILNSYNTGDVISEYTGTGTQGNAGGLIGYLTSINNANPHLVKNCYNTGNVTANQRVGGLSGGAFNALSKVENCYSSGKVVCRKPDSQGRYYWSGTTFTNNYTQVVSGDTLFILINHKDCFYDKTVNPATNYFRYAPNSAKTSVQMQDPALLGDAFVSLGHGGYPVLKDFVEHDAAHAGSAMILLADKSGEAHANVTDVITLVAPEGAEWSAVDAVFNEDGTYEVKSGASSAFVFDGGRAIPRAKGDVILTCTHKGMSKNFFLTVNGTTSSVDEEVATSEILSVEYIDLQGRRVAEPQRGEVYIVKTTYVDGTSSVAKKIAVK